MTAELSVNVNRHAESVAVEPISVRPGGSYDDQVSPVMENLFPPAISEGVTIVCVFNDPQVRLDCLDRSLVSAIERLPCVEYLPVDNVNHQFTSAGAALNSGARLARKDVILFVHQDVVIHDVAVILDAACHARQNRWGIIGGAGITSDAQMVGRHRDRVVIAGKDAPAPVEVDTVDEFAFMVTRSQVLDSPLAEEPELAWHAYAVEYCVRMRSGGRGVGAMNLRLTHNSLTTNLAKLDAAHRFVAGRYPSALPVVTTCGVITQPTSRRRLRQLRFLASQRWRLRWAKNSVTSWRAKVLFGRGTYVISDIRLDIDLLEGGEYFPAALINLPSRGDSSFSGVGQFPMNRRHHQLAVHSPDSMHEAIATLLQYSGSATVLLSNIDRADLRRLAQCLRGASCVLGVHEAAGTWLLFGPEVIDVPAQWTRQRARPAMMRATSGRW